MNVSIEAGILLRGMAEIEPTSSVTLAWTQLSPWVHTCICTRMAGFVFACAWLLMDGADHFVGATVQLGAEVSGVAKDSIDWARARIIIPSS